LITEHPPPKHDPFKALRYPEFRYYLISSFLLTLAQLIQEVLVGYELYRITGDPLAIGMIGIAEAVPFIMLSLFGGHFADKFSKKKMMLWALFFVFIASTMLFILSFELLASSNPRALQYVIWGVAFFIGICRAFFGPASTSLRAFLVPREAYANSAAWSSSSWQAGSIAGPALSGFIYALFGFSYSLLFVMGLIIVSIFLVLKISDRKINDAGNATMFQMIKKGFAYTYKTKLIFYSISLDMFSVMFGGVVAILPVFARDILNVGPEGLGLLRSAPSAGAVIVLIFLTKYPPVKYAWRKLLLAVAGFGAATLVFAVSESYILSAAALFFTGAFDSVSVVIRSTILQLFVPDNMRGRVNAINGIFISTSNEIGAFESGLAAKLLGAVPSVVFGGVMTLIVTFYIYIRSKNLLKLNLTQSV
jgi:MFS family permease